MCGQVSYCNTACQKAHWKAHKATCKAHREAQEANKTASAATGASDLQPQPQPQPQMRPISSQPLLLADQSHVCGLFSCMFSPSRRFCTRCEITHYCSKNHQLMDWDRHKLVCRTVSEQKAQREVNVALLMASFEGQLREVRRLVEQQGAEINFGWDEQEGFTALHASSHKNHPAVVEYLVSVPAE
jgi:hypothetical protein